MQGGQITLEFYLSFPKIESIIESYLRTGTLHKNFKHEQNIKGTVKKM